MWGAFWAETMKRIVQNYKSSEIALLEVPLPACRSGGVLVRSDFSLISIAPSLAVKAGIM